MHFLTQFCMHFVTRPGKTYLPADLSPSAASQSLLRRWGYDAEELSQIEEHLHVLSTAHQPDDDSW